MKYKAFARICLTQSPPIKAHYLRIRCLDISNIQEQGRMLKEDCIDEI